MRLARVGNRAALKPRRARPVHILAADQLVLTIATYDSVRSLPLEIDGYELEPLEREVARGFTLRRTVVVLRGGGEEGRGEEVDYDPAQQARFQEHGGELPLAGEHTLESFSLLQAGQTEYRRWALESAALDLALRQAGVSLGEAIGRTPQPVRFVVSTRVTNVLRWLELYPDLRFKLDPGTDWTDEIVASLAATGRVDTVDFKGIYRGEFGSPPDAELYRRIAAAFPSAWIEDPGLTPEVFPVLAEHRDRITWDAGIHEWSDVEALPFQPLALNCKPSRFGSVRRLFDFYDACAERGIALRRRPVRARARTRADPAARVALPSGRAERRRAVRLQRDRAGCRAPILAATPHARAGLSDRCCLGRGERENLRSEPGHRPVARRSQLVPGRAGARLTTTDEQVADVEVEVGRLAGALRDLVDVDVERPRRGGVQLDLEGGLLARLAQRCSLEREVGRLDVAARLQQPAELHVLDEARPESGLVDRILTE